MTTEKTAEQKIPGWKRWYRYWALLPALVVNCWCGYGMWYTSFAPFLIPMTKIFGVTRAVATGAQSTGNLFQVLGPALGAFMDRVGYKRAAIVSAIVMMIGALFIAFSAPPHIWMVYVGFILLNPVGLSILTYPGATKTINFWFLNRRMLALGIVVLIVGSVYLSAAPEGALIEQFGMAGGGWYLFGLGIPILLVTFLVVKNKASDMGVGLDGGPLPAKATDGGQKEPAKAAAAKEEHLVVQLTIRQVLRSPALWLTCFSGAFLNIIANSFQLGNYVAFLQGLGMSAAAAGVIWGMMGFCGWPARFVYGWLADYFGRGSERWLYAIGTACMAVGVVGLLQVKGPQDFFWVWWWTAWWGFGWGGNMTAAYGLVATFFGPSIYGTVYGIRSVFVALGGVIGPIMGGWIFDVTGSYTAALWVCVICLVISVVMLCLAVPPKVKLGETAARTV